MRHWLYTTAILVLLSGVGGTAFAQGAGAPPPQHVATSSPKTEVKPAEFAGSETCVLCHAEVAKKFDANPHSKLALMHGGKGVTCESCHGPGQAHVESGGDVTKLFRFEKATPKQVDEKCLSCHLGTHANFDRTAHGDDDGVRRGGGHVDQAAPGVGAMGLAGRNVAVPLEQGDGHGRRGGGTQRRFHPT